MRVSRRHERGGEGLGKHIGTMAVVLAAGAFMATTAMASLMIVRMRVGLSALRGSAVLFDGLRGGAGLFRRNRPRLFRPLHIRTVVGNA